MSVGRRSLTLRERRKLGITFFGVLRTLRAMKADGVDVAGVSKRERAEMVFSQLVDDRPVEAAGIDWENIDWEKVMEVIEKIIEMILKLIALL